MNRQRLSSAAPRVDLSGMLYVLRDNLGKADAFITSVEDLIERPGVVGGDGGGDDDGDEDNLGRLRNHVAHLVESAKLAVRAAIYAGIEIDKHRGTT